MIFEEILARCIAQLEAGDTVESCLAKYPEQAAELEPLLRAVSVLRAAPAPLMPDEAFARGRRAVAEVVQTRRVGADVHVDESAGERLAPAYDVSAVLAPPPSPAHRRRSRHASSGRLFAWPRFAAALVAASLILAVAVGSQTPAVLPAQGPLGALYSVKLLVEQARGLLLARGTSGRNDDAEWHASLVDRRLAELERLHAQGEAVAPVLVERLLDEANLVLEASAGLPEAARLPLLDGLRQDLALAGELLGADAPVLAALQQTEQEIATLRQPSGSEAVAIAAASPTPAGETLAPTPFVPAPTDVPREETAPAALLPTPTPVGEDLRAEPADEAPAPAPTGVAAGDVAAVEQEAVAPDAPALPVETPQEAGAAPVQETGVPAPQESVPTPEEPAAAPAEPTPEADQEPVIAAQMAADIAAASEVTLTATAPVAISVSPAATGTLTATEPVTEPVAVETQTAQPTATITPTLEITPTATGTPTLEITPTATVTPTGTMTPASAPALTDTATPAPTVLEPAPDEVMLPTPTPQPSEAVTPTPEEETEPEFALPTPTPTPRRTQRATSVPLLRTPTATPALPPPDTTLTATAPTTTVTASPESTSTPEPSATSAATPTHTPIATWTLTATPVEFPVLLPTPTPDPDLLQPTPTPTATAEDTPTLTPVVPLPTPTPVAEQDNPPTPEAPDEAG